MARRRSLFLEAKEQLIDLLVNDLLEMRNNQLPSEEELSNTINISRTTMRELLASLNREGAISKKHGIGNFVHFSALKKRMRIDQFRDFHRLIRMGGYTARSVVNLSSFRTGPGGETFKSDFGLAGGDDFFSMTCTFYADEIPAIYCLMHIPMKMLKRRPTDEVEENIYSFIRKYCDEDIVQTMIWFEPIACSGELSSVFGLPEGVPMMEWKEEFYTVNDQVVCFSYNYFNPEVMKVCMVRKTWEDFY